MIELLYQQRSPAGLPLTSTLHTVTRRSAKSREHNSPSVSAVKELSNVISPAEREIDLEVRALVDEAYANAKNCLIEHRDQLEKIANALLEKETISIDEINTLLGLTPPVMQAILLDTPAEAPVENTEAENSAAENSDEQ